MREDFFAVRIYKVLSLLIISSFWLRFGQNTLILRSLFLAACKKILLSFVVKYKASKNQQ